MRPSLRPKEERKWVLDTINQYFDVIVEEEDEEPNSEDEDSSDDDSIDSLSEYDDDEIPDEEYEEPNNAGYKSSSRMRSLYPKRQATSPTVKPTWLACQNSNKILVAGSA